MAELLVKASGHWMDSFTQKQVDALSTAQRQSYEARSQKGDIVVVRPDGWKWGKEECLPNFIVVKVSDIPIKEAKLLESQLTEVRTRIVKINGKDVERKFRVIIRFRKNALPKTDVTACKTGVTELTKTALTSKVVVKTGLAVEITSPIEEIKEP